MKQTRNTFSRVATVMTAAMLWSAAGCDQPAQSSKPTTNPTVAVAPAATQPTDVPAVVAAYPVRPPSSFNIDGSDVTFPGAKLVVSKHGAGGYTLCLCSDDPPTAINPGYDGNSYVMYMRLAIDHLSDLPAATWDCKPTDAEDPSSGIFIHGFREQYHPDAVHVSFEKNGNDLMVIVSGTFLHSDPASPVAPPVHVQVSGSLRTDLPTE